MASSRGGSGASLLDHRETFAALCTTVGLDNRLRKALARLGFVRPTLVQSKAIPLAITSGRDLLVRARTGSGKTLAYCVPLLQKVLARKEAAEGEEEDDDSSGHVRAVVLVPTRELCTQVSKVLTNLTYYCDEVVNVAVLSSAGGTSGGKRGVGKKRADAETALQQEAMLRDRPDVVVSTPAGLLTHVRSGALKLKKSVESLVVDEADLILSFGYANDIAEIMKSLPKICQGFLMSATLSPELNNLKRVVLHSPAVLKLEEEEAQENSRNGKGTLTQFYLDLPKRDKNLVLYVFLKLGLLKGKGLFFVNTTDGGYRLKLFLEQFHIRSAVLNAELPLRSRLNIIEQFNVGNFDYLIATDESTDAGHGSEPKEEEETIEDEGFADSDNEAERKGEDHGTEKMKKESTKKVPKQHRHRGKKKDSEYGVSRGLDFRGVSFVVNVDFPPTPESYTHRIGRTARGGANGVALSLVDSSSSEQSDLLRRVQSSQPPLPGSGSGRYSDADIQPTAPEDGGGDKVLQQLQQQVQVQPSPLDFDLKEIEGFRYRVEDVSRAVTKVAVRETRAAEVKAEMLNSERLQSHFEENPTDLQLLQHDRQATHVSKVQDHLKHVPKYMLPRGMHVAESSKRRKRRRSRGNRENRHGRTDASRRTDNDPLQSFEGEVNLDGVADDGEEGDAAGDAEFFDDENGDDIGRVEKKQKSEEGKVFMDTADGVGRSTSGRNAWKMKHSKGKYSKRYKKKNEAGKW